METTTTTAAHAVTVTHHYTNRRGSWWTLECGCGYTHEDAWYGAIVTRANRHAELSPNGSVDTSAA